MAPLQDEARFTREVKELKARTSSVFQGVSLGFRGFLGFLLKGLRV